MGRRCSDLSQLGPGRLDQETAQGKTPRFSAVLHGLKMFTIFKMLQLMNPLTINLLCPDLKPPFQVVEITEEKQAALLLWILAFNRTPHGLKESLMS